MNIKFFAFVCILLFSTGCTNTKKTSLDYRNLMLSLTQLDNNAVCKKSIDESGENWNLDYAHYVLEAKRRGITCGTKLTKQQYTSAIYSKYTNIYLCTSAYDKIDKEWSIYTSKYNKEIQKRRLNKKNCDRILAQNGIYISTTKALHQKKPPTDKSSSDTNSNASLGSGSFPLSDDQLCDIATSRSKNGIVKWSFTLPKYIKEAKARRLSCSVSNKSQRIKVATTPNSNQKAISTNKIDSKDIAIIIGNSDYKRYGQDIPNVLPAKNDAMAFKKFALENLGIKTENIIYINDATTSQLERVFGNYRSHKGNAYNWVRPGKSKLYVYYAGHGAPGNDGTAYLIPSDASANSIDINGYPISTLYANLSKIPSLSTTVVLESCFSGNSPSGSVISNASPVYQKANDISIPPNLTVITAGSMNQLASWTPDKKHGLFTYHYIKGMSGDADGADYGNQDGDVSLPELQAYLDDNVTYYARRHYGRDQNVQISLAE